MTFINEDFFPQRDTARRLYHDYAADQPTFEDHSHISPKDIATDRQFNDLFEIWLGGDHYKWRAMRANGVAEEYPLPMEPPGVETILRDRCPS